MDFKEVILEFSGKQMAFQHISKLFQNLQNTSSRQNNSVQLNKIIDDIKGQYIQNGIAVVTPKFEKAINNLGYSGLVGKDGMDKLEVFKSSFKENFQQTRNEILNFINEFKRLSSLINSVNNLSNSINFIDEIVEENEIDGLKIFFIRDADIETLKELSKESNNWNKMLFGFARVAGSNETDFRIVSVESGSIIIQIAALAGIVLGVAKAINEVLKIINNSLQIKKHTLDLKKMKNEGLNKAIKELDKNSKIDVTVHSLNISNLVVNNFDYNAADKGEVENALKYSISQLFKFYLNGGKVDLLLTQESQEDNIDLLEQLNARNKELNTTKEAIRLLENESSDLELLQGNIEEE